MASSNIIDTVKEKINSLLSQYPQIDEPISKLSAKVGVEKPYVVVAAAVIPLIVIFALGTGAFVVDLVGFVYPLYASIKAIESPAKGDDSLWLTYWIIFSSFKIVEGVADFLIGFIPFYFVIKVAFLVWCYYPTTTGAKTLYELIIKPYIVPKLGIDASKKSD